MLLAAPPLSSLSQLGGRAAATGRGSPLADERSGAEMLLLAAPRHMHRCRAAAGRTSLQISLDELGGTLRCYRWPRAITAARAPHSGAASGCRRIHTPLCLLDMLVAAPSRYHRMRLSARMCGAAELVPRGLPANQHDTHLTFIELNGEESVYTKVLLCVYESLFSMKNNSHFFRCFTPLFHVAAKRWMR